MPIEIKHGYCTLCRSRCGTISQVNNDTLVKVEPDTEHPTGAAMCMKGRAAPELVHSPNRLLYPMRRTTPKTADDPGWERISWQEAIRAIATKLSKIKAESGPEAVAFGVTTPSGTAMSDSIDWVERFVRTFQSPNICYGIEVCNWHKDHAHSFTFGCGMPTADYANTDLIMLWGHNPTSTWLSQANAIGKGRDKGAKMIVVDPRKTPLAASADVWLQVRPGTDLVVAMGLVRLMILRQGFHQQFVRSWTNAPFLVRCDNGTLLRADDCALTQTHEPDPDSFVVWSEESNAPVCYTPSSASSLDRSAHAALSGRYHVTLCDGRDVSCEPVFALLERACASYTPEVVELISGVESHSLVQASELISHSKSVAYHSWTGIGQHSNATQTERALAILYALTGSFDTLGGNRIYAQPPVRAVNGLDLIKPAQLNKALGIDERPLGPPAQGWVTTRDLYRAITTGQPYDVRAFFGFGTNFMASQGDVKEGIEALQQLEFHVHCDLFETPTSRFADILLPVNTPWEREALRAGFEINDTAVEHIQLRQRVVTPRGETKSDTEIVFALADELGMQEHFFDGNLEAGWNWMLEPLRLTVTQLRQQPKGVRYKLTQVMQKYACVSNGKVTGFQTPTQRVELYSETLLRHGYAPLPKADDPLAATQPHTRYPYTLTSVKNGYFCHSQHRSLVSLRKRAPLPTVLLNENLAVQKNIKEGDWVLIETSTGQARFSAILSKELSAGVIVAEFGWWQACNELGRDGYAIVGPKNSNYNSLICTDNSDPISGSVPMRSSRCDVRLDPTQDIRRRTWQGFRTCRVRNIQRQSQDVASIELETPDSSLLPDYLPGQHITLRVNTGSHDQPLVRAYSLIGAAREHDRTSFRIAVRHQQGVDSQGNAIEGQVSSYLNRVLKVGQELLLGTPGGNFVLPTTLAQPVILFAGGIGITPFISYLQTLADSDSMPEVWLHYANRNSLSHAFSNQISELQSRLPRLTVINYYNEPLSFDTKGVDYDDDAFLSAAVVPDTLIKRRARVYMCGPGPMMTAITEQLAARGVPRFDIFSEVFRSPKTIDLNGNQKYQVSFLRSHPDNLNWTPAAGALLDFAEKQNIHLPSGCRVGQCESCAVRIVSGQVYHLSGNEPDDPAVCLTCQAIPVSDLELDI